MGALRRPDPRFAPGAPAPASTTLLLPASPQPASPHPQGVRSTLRPQGDSPHIFLVSVYSSYDETTTDWLSAMCLMLYTSVQLSRVFATRWIAVLQASLTITISRSLLKLIFIESVTPSNHLILCHPLLLLPSICPSIRVFSNESVFHIRWPKYWSFSFSISPSSEYSGLISSRMDWLDLLAVQGTPKSLLKHQFFGTQLSL